MLREIIAALVALTLCAPPTALGAGRASPPVILGTSPARGTLTELRLPLAESYSGAALSTPVLIANGRQPGPTLCLTAAIHGDELNGIAIVRNALHALDVEALKGAVIGVPVVNVLAFERGARETPDRRDLNRYFPGRPTGSFAARIAHALYANVVAPNCDYLIDFHTGSFNRANLPQLRADLSDAAIGRFVAQFGPMAVLRKRGSSHMLRRVASLAGIPSVSYETGSASTLQAPDIEQAQATVGTVLVNLGMLPGTPTRSPALTYGDSHWVRAGQGGIFFASKALGDEVSAGEVIGTIINPLTDTEERILAPVAARILGLASNQSVLPGYGVFHLGVRERSTAK